MSVMSVLRPPSPGPVLPRLEDRSRIAHEHLLDLLLGDTGLPERRQDVVGDVVVVPARPRPALIVLGDHVSPTVGVVGEDHLARVPFGAQPGQHRDPLFGGQKVFETEAVHPDRAPPLHQSAKVAKVLTVAAVADDDAPEVDTLLREDRLLSLAGAAGQVGVEIGTPVAFWARADALRMFSITGVTPAVSVAHLMIPALTPPSPMPRVMSRMNSSATASTP